MIDWKEQEKIIDLRNTIQYELQILAMSYTDFNREIVIEDENGNEKLIPVKEVSYEAKPNSSKGATERIIKDFTEKLGWEYISNYKQAWVDGYIKHCIYFKF